MKRLEGCVAYVTRSPYLADHASRLYHAHDYDPPGREVEFLSFPDFLGAIRVPEGRPVTFRAFEAWFARHRPSLSVRDAHMVFEEFSGVLTGAPTDRPHLTRDEYLALGVRRSIFLGEQREEIWRLFERYLAWLRESGHYEPSIEAFRALEAAEPTYDAVVVDEVQDLTNVQLHLILSTLREPGRFLLSGDAHQLVHPNFFSWDGLHTMFYEQRVGGSGRRITRLLCANYRNAAPITALANRVLRLKHLRFGSVDRESTRLARAAGPADGRVDLVGAEDRAVVELDEKTRESARAAVIVLREADKAEARARFRTPLLFSVQEAKGLEYETIIAFNLVSSAAREFGEIAAGIEPRELADDAPLEYARAKDKSDKSAEALKFFINALYVTISRAVRTLVFVERRPDHPLTGVLGLRPTGEAVRRMSAQRSDAEEWRREARRLELQGHTEQAEAIRATVLGQQPVPWRVVTPSMLEELDREALDPQRFNKQAKNLMFDYAVVHTDFERYRRLAELGYRHASQPIDVAARDVEVRLEADYRDPRLGALRQKIDRYGINFRNHVNETPLMIAARLGMTDLVRRLLEQGADPSLRDNFGRTALHHALIGSVRRPKAVGRSLAELWELLAPEAIHVQSDGRLRRLDRRRLDYLVFEIMMAALQPLLRERILSGNPALRASDVLIMVERWPERLLPAQRRTRDAISNVLASHEMFRPDPSSKRLFVRLERGGYLFNPDLKIQQNGEWIPIYDLIALDVLAKSAGRTLGRLRRRLADVRRSYRQWRAELSKPKGTEPRNAEERVERAPAVPTMESAEAGPGSQVAAADGPVANDASAPAVDGDAGLGGDAGR